MGKNKGLPYFDLYPVSSIEEADYIKIISVNHQFKSWFTEGERYRLKKDEYGKLYIKDNNKLNNYGFQFLTQCEYYSANPKFQKGGGSYL